MLTGWKRRGVGGRRGGGKHVTGRNRRGGAKWRGAGGVWCQHGRGGWRNVSVYWVSFIGQTRVLSVQKLILGFPDVRCANKYQFKYSKSGVKYNILMIVVDLTPQCCSLKFSLIS